MGEVAVTPELIAEYARAVGEEDANFGVGAMAPPMFAAVYAGTAIWPAVLTTVEGAGPLIHAAQEFEWYAPVHGGDRIATSVHLADEHVKGPWRSLRFCSVSYNSDDELVSRGYWTIFVAVGGL